MTDLKDYMLGQTQDSIKGCFFHLEVSEGQAQDYIVFCVSQSFLGLRGRSLCFAVVLDVLCWAAACHRHESVSMNQNLFIND